jgi:hypothetical protein
LLVRVGPDAHQATLDEQHVEPMGMRGRTMTGFVRVAPEGYRTDAGLKKWVERGVDFVVTMPSKLPARKGNKSETSKRARTG